MLFFSFCGPAGLNFAVFTFPVIAIAIVGFIYLELKQKEPTSRYAFYLQYICKHTNVEYRHFDANMC